MTIDFQHQTRTYLGLYETELNKYLRRVLRPGVTAFDVGARDGYDSLVIAKHTQAPVAAFECDPSCVVGMAESLALNPTLTGFVRTVNAMVGDQEGQLALDAWAYSDGFVPDFVKLDIDGGEVGALLSAERILRERRPPVIVEVHSLELERDCARILATHGYTPRVVSQRRFAPDIRPIEHNRWLVAL